MNDGQRDVDTILYLFLAAVLIGLVLFLLPDEIARLAQEGDRP